MKLQKNWKMNEKRLKDMVYNNINEDENFGNQGNVKKNK